MRYGRNRLRDYASRQGSRPSFSTFVSVVSKLIQKIKGANAIPHFSENHNLTFRDKNLGIAADAGKHHTTLAFD